MALIAMAVYDTEENKRLELTKRTVDCILKTTDLNKHRLVIIDNDSCKQAKDYLMALNIPTATLITMSENVGTAKAINVAWLMRKPGEHCIKIDNDVEIHYNGWVDDMELYLERDKSIGQIGLKRKDCWENPRHENDFYRTELYMLPHIGGERWLIAEQANHIMGTCVMHSSDLLDKVGYLFQPSLYGFDDSLMSLRANKAGFKTCFIPHIDIDHIDPGQTPYQSWKEKRAGNDMAEYERYASGILNGTIKYYFDEHGINRR